MTQTRQISLKLDLEDIQFLDNTAYPGETRTDCLRRVIHLTKKNEENINLRDEILEKQNIGGVHKTLDDLKSTQILINSTLNKIYEAFLELRFHIKSNDKKES